MTNKLVKKIEKWEDYDSVETIFKLIVNTEYEMGEDFIDQNENIVKGMPFVFYLLGKGAISKDKANVMVEKGVTLQEMMYDFEEDWSLFPYGECDAEANGKWLYLLSELIFEFDEYKKRLFKILSDIPYTNNYEDVVSMTLDESDYKSSKEGVDNIGSWFKNGTIHDRFLHSKETSIEDINTTTKYRYDNQ